MSDHTKAGTNDATDDPRLSHTLSTALDDVSREFRFGYSMIVGDVDAAYPLLPIAWWLWPLFMFVWFDVDASDTCSQFVLYMHITGDFGTRGFPGTFKIFRLPSVLRA